MAYTFGTKIEGEFTDVVDQVTVALAAEGFGVLTTIDVAATLRAKLGIEREPYVILGACNPPLANQAISADPEIGALLPCNVVVRQDADGVAVRFMDPAAVLGIVDVEGVADVAAQVRARLERVAASL
jgi:uncharacterized protein (DUF302 family)